MTEQEERFWYGGTKAEIEAAYQKARKQLLDGLHKADDKLAYLRDEAEKQGFVFSNNPYMVLPDIRELCKFFDLAEYELEYEEVNNEATTESRDFSVLEER